MLIDITDRPLEDQVEILTQTLISIAGHVDLEDSDYTVVEFVMMEIHDREMQFDGEQNCARGKHEFFLTGGSASTPEHTCFFCGKIKNRKENL